GMVLELPPLLPIGDAEIRLAVLEARLGLGADQPDIRVRMRALPVEELRADPLDGERRQAAHHQAALHAGARQDVLRILQLREAGGRPLVIEPAPGGELEVPAAALEEPHAQRLLEPAQLLADGALGDAQLTGRLADAAEPADGFER